MFLVFFKSVKFHEMRFVELGGKNKKIIRKYFHNKMWTAREDGNFVILSCIFYKWQTGMIHGASHSFQVQPTDSPPPSSYCRCLLYHYFIVKFTFDEIFSSRESEDFLLLKCCLFIFKNTGDLHLVGKKWK